MGRGTLMIGLLFALAASPSRAAAQDTWVSGWAGAIMNPGTVQDFDSGTQWRFGTTLMAGVGVQRSLGQGLLAGLDLGYSPVRHEVRDLDTGILLDEGRANIVTALLTGRLGATRAAGFGTYLAGGVGAMLYGVPHLDGWDADLALRGGGGVEYAVSRELLLFLEWHRWWVFHQSEGVQDNTVNQGTLEIGARFRL